MEKSPRSERSKSLRQMTLLALTWIAFQLTGCGKVPTWNELTGGGSKPAPVSTRTVPSTTEVLPGQPAGPMTTSPDPAQTLAWFKALSPQQMTDQGFAQLTSIASGLEAITEINANGSLVTDTGLVELGKLPALQKLSLDNTSVTDAGMKSLQKVGALQSLAMNSTKITAAGIEHLAGLPTLKRLELVGCKLSEPEFAAIGKLPAIEVLVLNRMTSLTDSGLDAICEASTLKVLQLNECSSVTDNGLAALAKVPGLEELYLSRIGISGTGIGAAISKGGLKSLKVLVVSYAPIAVAGVRAINSIKTLERLEFAFVPGFNDTALVELLKGLNNLKYLDVEASPLLTGQGFKTIKATTDSLETLAIQNTNVNDLGLSFLKSHKKLKFIDVSNTHVTLMGVQQFKQLLPGCVILHAGIRH